MIDETMDCPACGEPVFRVAVDVRRSRILGRGKTVERRRCPACGEPLAFTVRIERRRGLVR